MESESATDIPLPSREQLRKAFDRLSTSVEEGVPGVLRFSSGRPGPVLGITVCTHGNEPTGLAPLWYFDEIFPLAEHLVCGEIYFVLNNLEAAANYWKAETDAEKLRSRFVDYNFNRLEEGFHQREGDTRYETRRAKELLPIWSRFEVAMDIHSTSMPAPPMIVTDHDLDFELVRGFPINHLITNVRHVMRDHLALEFYGKPGKARTVLVETGQHEQKGAWMTAILCAKALLRNLGMLNGELVNHLLPLMSRFDHYHVEGSIFFPDESYELVKVFENFEEVKRGELLAHGNGEALHAPLDGHALMCYVTTRPPMGEEALFFSRPVERLDLDAEAAVATVGKPEALRPACGV